VVFVDESTEQVAAFDCADVRWTDCCAEFTNPNAPGNRWRSNSGIESRR